MKSNICKIEKGTKDLAAILKESEKVAVYNELNHKQTLQLRLMCEEIDGLLPEIIKDFNGDLWIDFEDGVCKVNVSVEIEKFTAAKKEELINIAKNKKNAAATTVTGKIRSVLENFFLDEDVQQSYTASTIGFHLPMGYVDYSYLWSLEQYRANVEKEAQTQAWDELEKSVLASVADDVIVGVKGKSAHIVIVKKFF